MFQPFYVVRTKINQSSYYFIIEYIHRIIKKNIYKTKHIYIFTAAGQQNVHLKPSKREKEVKSTCLAAEKTSQIWPGIMG